jgi:hypothetical protein
MLAPTSAAITPFEVVLGSENHQALFVDVIVFIGEFWYWLLFAIHGLAKGHFLYLGSIS